MGIIKETLSLFGLTVLFDFFKDVIERIKKFLIPPKAFSWQTLIYLSLFSLLMALFSTKGSFIRDIIAFFGWVFLIAGTSWYTTDKPLYVPGTVMPVGAVITGGIISIYAFQRNGNGDMLNGDMLSRTIIFWPTISALITAIPEFFEGSGTDVKTQLPKLEDRESVIVLIGCCMLLSCWLNIYGITDDWLSEYPSAKYAIGKKEVAQSSDLLTILEPENEIPKNGVLILDKLQTAVETSLRGKSWSNVELWLKNANQNVNEIGKSVINIYLAEFEEKDLWTTQANVDNIDPKDLNSGYRLNLFSVWGSENDVPNKYYLQKSCQIEPITEPVDTLSPQNQKIIVAEVECLPKISYSPGQPANQ